MELKVWMYGVMKYGYDVITCSKFFTYSFTFPDSFTRICWRLWQAKGSLNNITLLIIYNFLKANGYDVIACLSVNDTYVMSAWGDSAQATGKVTNAL